MNSASRKALQRGPDVPDRPQPAPPDQSGSTELVGIIAVALAMTTIAIPVASN